jgi:hypothetical protein
MSRQILIATLKDYFASKGKFLSMDEYKEQEDAPYRFQIVKRTVGSWSRLKGLIGEVAAAPVAAPKPAPKPVAKQAPAPAPEAPAPEAPAPEVEAPEGNG